MAIICGPIISSLNLQQPLPVSVCSSVPSAATSDFPKCASLLQMPEPSQAFEEFFQCLYSAARGLKTQFVIVPSTRDAMHPEPLPQPPYSPPPVQPQQPMHQQQLLQQPMNVHLVGNPCTLQVNELQVLITTADPLAEVAGEVLSLSRPQPLQPAATAAAAAVAATAAPDNDEGLVHQLCRSLVRQGTLFPRGCSPRVPIDASRMQPVMFKEETTPDVFIFASSVLQQLQLNKQVGPFVAPGGAGACLVDGRVFVSPFSNTASPEVCPVDRVSITNMYVKPPAEAAGQPGSTLAEDLCLNQRVAVTYTVYTPRNALKKGPAGAMP